VQFTERIVVRGGGDLGTGVVQKFHRAGFPVVILETSAPTAIRRTVALCEAVYDSITQVEDVICRRVNAPDELEACWQAGDVPLLIDPDGKMIRDIQPNAAINAILAKRNIGTSIDMASITIALGPGYCAGKDVHAVIETMRGHDLGRLILQGNACPNTGMPGEIGGKTIERVLRAPVAGKLVNHKRIGEIARQGEVLFTVDDQAVYAPFTGLVRGMIRCGMEVTKDMKTADLDPRTDICPYTVSDKARCIGGAALGAYFYLRDQKQEV
jgi:xanthine dehydrogenase accessory factor